MSSRRESLTTLENPCKKWLEWRSSDESFAYWDKEEKQRVLVNLPLDFALLDVLFTIKGYNEPEGEGIYSNEVRDIKTDTFTVKQGKNKTIAEGTYNVIKETVLSAGAAFHFSIYGCDKDGNLINIKLKSYQDKNNSGNDSKINFFSYQYKNNVVDYTILANDTLELKKGANKYKVPVFVRGSKIEDETLINAAYDTLQDYLNYYLKVQELDPIEENSEDEPELPEWVTDGE